MANAKKPQPGEQVGYGKPPEASQFKKGKSGNPTGRPKQTRPYQSVRRVVRECLEREIPIIRNGRRKTVTLLEAVMQKLAKLALEDGNTQAIKLMLSLAGDHIPANPTLADLMGGRSVLEFTKEEAKLFSYENLVKGMTLPDAAVTCPDSSDHG